MIVSNNQNNDNDNNNNNNNNNKIVIIITIIITIKVLTEQNLAIQRELFLKVVETCWYCGTDGDFDIPILVIPNFRSQIQS